MPPDEMRSDLEAAFDADVEKDDAAIEGEVVKVEEEPTPSPEALLEDKTPEDKPAEIVDDEPPEEKPEPIEDGPKAPVGWTPAVREEWAALPRSVQDEVLRRERSYAQGIQKYAEDGKFGRTIKDTLSPFQQIMQMEGADEVTAVANLAKTAATLRLGTPQEKAGLIAKMIFSYGIDIEALDSVLSGEELDPQAMQLQQMLDQRFAPVDKLVQDLSSARTEYGQRTTATVDAEITEFEKTADFLGDVREDMADFLDVAAKRGQKMTLQDAYDRAVAMRPDLQEIVHARAEQARMAANAAKIAAKEDASKSVPGQTSSGGSSKPETIRGALEEAYDASVRA